MKEKFLGEIGKKALIDKVYDDVFHPVLSEVGCSLQGIARVLLAPIAALSWSYNKISAYLDKTISKYFEERKILGEKIELTGSDIAVMDIGTLCFVDEGVIKEISGNKSEVSMKLKTANFVAPSFADIIEQLTPGEVIIVKMLSRKGSHEPLMYIREEKKVSENSTGIFRAQTLQFHCRTGQCFQKNTCYCKWSNMSSLRK